MAGFDWFFTYGADDEAAVRAMLTASRRRARRMEVQWSSRTDSSAHHTHVTTDGPWWLLELLIARLDRDLPAICEAIEDSRRRPGSSRPTSWGHSFSTAPVPQISVSGRQSPSGCSRTGSSMK